MNLDLVILKTLVTNKKYALEFASESDAKLFSPDTWNTANIIINHINTYKELPTLRILVEKLEKNNNAKLIENVKKVWEQLETTEYNDKEYHHDLIKFKKRFAEKQIMDLKEKLGSIEEGSINLPRIVSDINKSIQSITALDTKKTFEVKNAKDYLSTFIDKFKAKKNDPNVEAGLKTGYSFIDYATNGFKAADMLLIAGESGFGKSLMLNNIGVQVWLQNNTLETIDFSQGKNIIYFSLEMPYEDCFNRFLSKLSGVPTRALENPRFMTREQNVLLKNALSFVKKYPYSFKIVDITDACANDINLILDECEEDFDGIFVDYLGIMKPNRDSDEADHLKQGIISQELRSIGRKRSKPVFSAVQLNRKAPAKDSAENIGLSRLARSGTIATHATHVIQIESRPKEEMYSDFLFHFIKNRKGPKGKGVLYKKLDCATLIDKKIEVENDYLNDQFIDYEDISDELEELDF